MNKNVLFIGPFPPPFGGIANHTKLLFESKLNEDFNLSNINLNKNRGIKENVSKKSGINFSKFFNGLFAISKHLRNNKTDIVYIKVNGAVSCFREIIYMLYIKTFSKAKIVIHFHGMYKPKRRNFPFNTSGKNSILNKTIINFVFSLSNRTIFIAEVFFNDFKPVLSKKNILKSTYVNHFVDVKHYSFSYDKFVDLEKQINVLFIGRLSRDKGFHEIIKVIPNILVKYPNVRFHFCGTTENDNDLDEIRTLLDVLIDKNVVLLHGLVYGEKKKELLNISHIFLFPTRDDVFPNVILEALANGLSIVTTKIGVMPHILREPVNACFINMDIKNDLENKLLELLNDHERIKKTSLINYEYAKEVFDISIAEEKIKNIFNSLV